MSKTDDGTESDWIDRIDPATGRRTTLMMSNFAGRTVPPTRPVRADRSRRAGRYWCRCSRAGCFLPAPELPNPAYHTNSSVQSRRDALDLDGVRQELTALTAKLATIAAG